MLPIVTVFATNASLRETFAIVLENDCHVELARSTAAARRGSAPAVAVVATDAPAATASAIRHVWPEVPIVVVSDAESRRDVDRPRTGACEQHEVVDLDPHAIRRTVLKHLRPGRDAALRGCATSIGTALRGDWTPHLRRLAGFAAESRRTGPTIADDAAALIADADLLRVFSERSRQARQSDRFVHELVDRLRDRLDSAGAALALQRSAGGSRASGPLDLVDLIAALLAARLRSRRPEARIAAVATGSSLRIKCDLGAVANARCVSLALVLAGLALEPWSWRVLVRHGGASEEIIVCPNELCIPVVRKHST